MPTEKHFLEAVVDLARRLSWDHVYHTHDSRHSPAGFPDLILLRDDRVVVAELKVGKNQPSAEQAQWLEAFAEAGAEAFLWRDTDEDWQEILGVLK